MKLTKVSPTGSTSQITVSDAVFGVPLNDVLLAQAVRVYLANRRQGTSQVQTRSEVSRTKAKVYKQKGTGNARHGSRNAPIFVGGGVAHGPSGEQNWSLKLPKALKKQALSIALSLQAPETKIVTALETLDGKTKTSAKIIADVSAITDKVLIILPQATQESARSLYNLRQVALAVAEYVTPVQVLSADKILLHPDTIAILETRVSKK